MDFDPPGGSGLGVPPPQRQLVCSQDLVDPSRAQTEGLGPGAPVLAPWGSSLSRYGPGRVMVPPQDRDASGSLGGLDLNLDYFINVKKCLFQTER